MAMVSDVVLASCDSLVRVRPPTRPLARWLLEDRVEEVEGPRPGRPPATSTRGPGGINDAREVAQGSRPIRKLFSEQQRAFYTEHAPEDVGLDDLSVLGPITLLKLKFKAAEYARPLIAELWFYPDGSRILELSTKCPPSQPFQVAAEGRVLLTGRGVDLSGEQQTKTKTALRYFSRQLLNASA